MIRKFVMFFVLAFGAVSVAAQAPTEQLFGSVLNFPHVTAGENWNTSWLVHSQQGGQFTGSVEFWCYRTDGSLWNLSTNAGAAPFTLAVPANGSVKITSTAEGPRESGACQLVGNILMSANATISSPGQSDVSVPVSFPRRGFTLLVDSSQGRRVGFSVSNPIMGTEDPSPTKLTTVSLELVNSNGTKVGSTASFTLAQNGQKAAYLDEFFAAALQGGQFLGHVRVTTDSFVTLLGIQTQEVGGQSRWGVAQPLELDFQTTAELEKNSIQLVCFFPRDVPVDQMCREKIQFVWHEGINWYGKQLGLRGLGNELFVPILANFAGKPRVEVVVGKQDSSFYEAEAVTGNYSRTMDSEIADQLGRNKQFRYVAHHANIIGMGANVAGLMQSGSWEMFVAGPTKVGINNRWSNFSMEYLQSGADSPTNPTQLTTSTNVTRVVHIAAHELGHLLDLRHSSEINDTYPGVLASLMHCCDIGYSGGGMYWGDGYRHRFQGPITTISTSQLLIVLGTVQNRNLRDRR